MGNPHDSIALDWVRGEIQETLKQGQHALEAFVDNRDDTDRLRSFLTHLHQVHGTLRMVELFGAARLTEEMQEAAQALLNGTAAAPDDAIGVLMQAMLQLPQYLEQLPSCRDDFPLVLLPLLNDLRAARAEPLLSEASFFTPDLSPARFRARADAGERLRVPSVLGHLQKLRQLFQFAVAGINREQDLNAHFEYLDKVVTRLVKLCQQTPMGEVWLATGALIDSLKARSTPVDAAVKASLNELDLQLKRLTDENIDVLQQPAPEPLLKNILYYVARAADSDSPRIQEISERYRLADALPDEPAVVALRQHVSGPGRDTIRSVISALNEELALLKDQLDLFVRAESRQNSDLCELLPGLQQIAGTLALLGLAVPHTVVTAQVERVSGLVDSIQAVDEGVLLDIAGALLYVEATLNEIDRQPGRRYSQAQGSSDRTSDNSDLSLSRPHLTDASTALLTEARNSLEQVKSAIVAFIDSHQDRRELAEVPELLHSIRGGLQLILLGRAANLLASCEAFFRAALIDGRQAPEWQQLDILADVISAVEYYLELMAEGIVDSDALLDAAEKSLALLGFTESAAPTGNPARSAEPAPEPESDEERDSRLVDDEILETFLEEVREVLETIRESYPRFRRNPEDLGALRDVRRAFHTLKGSGRLVGATAIGELGWAVENLLNRILEGVAQPSDSVHQLLEDVVERLPGLADDFRMGQPASEVQQTIEQAEHLALARDPQVDALPVLTEDPEWERQDDGESPAADRSRATPTENGGNEPNDDAIPAIVTEEPSLRSPAQPRVEPGPADKVDDMAPAAALGEVVDPDLLEIFRSETETHLETLRRFLADARKQSSSAYTDAVSRALHTLKGSANTAGIRPIAKVIGPFEHYVKTARAQSIRADNRVVAMLQRLHDFVVEGLAQLEASPQLELAGAGSFLSDLDELARATLPQITGEDDGATNRPDACLVRIFLSDGMDVLLDGDLILAEWAQSGQSGKRLPQLEHELQKLALEAAEADLGDVSEMADVLLQFCSSGHQSGQALGDEFFAQARAGHDHLIDLLDQVAAGLSTRPDKGLVAQLREHIQRLEQTVGSVLCERVADSVRTGQALDENADSSFEHEDTYDGNTPDSDLPEQDEESGNGVTGVFPEEAGDLVDHIGELLRHWKHQPELSLQAEQVPLLHQLQQDLHSLEDGARRTGIAAIGDLSQALENLLERLVGNSPAAGGNPEDTEDLMLRSHDRLAAMVDSVRAGNAIRPAPDLIDEIQQYLAEARPQPGQHPEADERPAATSVPVTETPAPTKAPEGASEEDNQDAELRDIFLEEARDILDTSGHLLQQWQSDPANAHTLRTLQRELHTLKGGARMAQVSAIGDLSHVLEDLFEAVVEDRLSFSPAMGDLLFQCHDALARMVEQVAATRPLEDPVDLISQVENTINGTPVFTAPSAGPSLESSVTQDLSTLFLGEARDLESAIARSLEHWRKDEDGQPRLIADLQSGLHTLKGGARLANVDAVAELATFWSERLQGLLIGDYNNAATLVLSERCLETLGQFLDALTDGHKPSPLSARLAELIVPDPTGQEVADKVDVEVLGIFLEEADDLVKALERSLSDWHEEPGNTRFNHEAQRVLHTLKGGARLVNAAVLGDEAHRFESRLNDFQGSGEAPTESDWQIIDHFQDRLIELVEQVRQQYGSIIQGSAAPDSPTAPLPVDETQPQARLSAEQRPCTPEPAGQTQSQDQKAEHRQARRKADAARAAQDTIRVNAQLMDELVNLAGETSITRGRVEQQVNDFSHTLEDMVATIDRLREQLRRMEIETETQILFSAEKEYGSHYGEEFDPLEMDRYSSIQQLSRALGESASDLADLRETLAEKVRDTETLLLQQSRVNTELQEGLMQTRMTPFASVVPRLRRIVRQIGGELGKKVEFDVRNAEGELDRTVLERMVAPLEHMLRNALDHGIETVEDRIKAGKPGTGQVKLSLSREGGEVVLRMTDDGAGIPTDKVREKAIRNGLLQRDETVTDRDMLQFILQPGFSTAQSVTQISGRGVGMDVVASEIKQLGGSLDIDSVAGQGTTFTVHLPFTVSVNRALMVSTGEDLYAIPLNTIDGIVRVSTYELEEYYKPGSPPYEYAGQQYRLQYLGSLLHSEHQPKLQGQALPLPVILVRGTDQPMALQVDSLLGSREIVVKSLGPQFGSVRGVSGATILGDGNVVMILDLPAMIRADILSARQRQLAELTDEEPHHSEVRATTVMVVDDSVTVRKVTSRLLERHGMEVLLAKDGLDAVAQLQDHLPNVILLDIEMPRMDGFEVASFIRYDSRLKHIPIIMITSRTGSKHRQRATALGVDEYLGKPFQEQELLETIERLRE